MPTYQYACTACDERLEAVQSFTDAPLTACPACDGALRKVFSAVGVVFKGSGFYKTDSRAKSTASTAKEGSSTKDGSSGAGASTSADTKAATPKTESKPAAKTTTPVASKSA